MLDLIMLFLRMQIQITNLRVRSLFSDLESQIFNFSQSDLADLKCQSQILELRCNGSIIMMPWHVAYAETLPALFP